MRMSHIYQPVMLMELLKNGGRCHQEQIATAILKHDRSQAEYYTSITNNMVGAYYGTANGCRKTRSITSSFLRE